MAKQSKTATQGGLKSEILGLSDIRAISIIVVSCKSGFQQSCSLTYLLSFSFAYVVTLATSRRRLMFGQIKSCERLSLETRSYRIDSALLPYPPSLVQIPIHTRNINIASHRRRSKAHAIKARKQQTPLKRSMNRKRMGYIQYRRINQERGKRRPS